MASTTSEDIIEAALSSFAIGGYDGTTLAQIAGIVGIQKPSLYNHFSGKKELFLTVAEKVMKEVHEVMTDSFEKNQDKNIERRLYLVLADSTTFIFQKHKGMMYRRLLLFPPGELEEGLRALVQKGDQQIDELLQGFYEQGKKEEVISNLKFSVFRAAFYCLMDGLFTERFIYGEKEFKERFEGSWTVFWQGISAQ
ncbi:TetR/AcrR family transcriptional regulator [Natribacillus halophilus]|uniref:DNA-binding transcriptional regulator, AcrR family n=1 Tax=Natribacillus halophilus TaxID=549003 RepID=A0A1G8QH19_9BACI|nr:TetR/AcrR family transcriptional regulator [Natribacillus halophilus]SDJ04099.1 DNA-binding transcriptional regulator, AcrR family [Natribacillus halophilus]